MTDPIYLDYNATSPMAPEVLEATTSALRELWGNASSAHAYGRRAREAVEGARAEVAGLIGCAAEEILFTGGGTESDNAAVLGVAAARREVGRHLVISVVEHAAVERACARLEEDGWEVSRVGVDGDGRVAVDDVVSVLRPDTALVSIMHANNETGVLQPVEKIGAAVRSRGIPFHTDAAQSVGKLPCSVEAFHADLLTIAGHKLYGPKGVGALYLRRGTPFRALLLGAGHEGGRRAGTENVPGIVGLGAACGLARRELPARSAHLASLRDRLEQALRRFVPDLVVHGAAVERLPNTLYVALPGAPAIEVVQGVPGVAMGSGAACHSDRPHVSATLQAMGVRSELALCTLRLTLGSPTTEAEVDSAARLIGERAVELRDGR